MRVCMQCLDNHSSNRHDLTHMYCWRPMEVQCVVECEVVWLWSSANSWEQQYRRPGNLPVVDTGPRCVEDAHTSNNQLCSVGLTPPCLHIHKTLYIESKATRDTTARKASPMRWPRRETSTWDNASPLLLSISPKLIPSAEEIATQLCCGNAAHMCTAGGLNWAFPSGLIRL